MGRSRRGIPHANFWMGKPYVKNLDWVEQIKRVPCAGGHSCSHKECLSNRSLSPPAPPVKPPCMCYDCQHQHQQQHQNQHQHHEPTPPPSPSISHGSEDEIIRGVYCCTSSVKRGREQREPSPEKAQCTCHRPISPPVTVCPECQSQNVSPASVMRPQIPKPTSISPLQSCYSCRRVFGWEDPPATRGPYPTPPHTHHLTGKPRTKPLQAKCTCKRHPTPADPEIRHCDCCHKDYHSNTGSRVSPYDDASSNCSSVRVFPDYDREVDESRCGAYHRCRPKFDCRQGWVCGRK